MTKNEKAALRTVKKYRKQVDLLEDAASALLAQRWVLLQESIEKDMKQLTDDDRLGLPLGFRYEQNFRSAIISRLDEYAVFADRTMTELSQQTARLGVDAANESAAEITGKGVTWKKVSISGLFIGGIFDASRDALRKIPGAISDKLGQLVSQAAGMAEQGLEWMQSQIGELLGGAWRGFQRVIRTAAEQMFRRAQQEQRQQIPLQQWRRMANHETACLACLMLEGTIYDREEDFADHPNGRCYIGPCEPGSKEERTGKQWLEEQDEETQRRIMGKGRFEAWQRGELDLDQMTDVRPDPVYGPQPHVIPLKELGIAPAK